MYSENMHFMIFKKRLEIIPVHIYYSKLYSQDWECRWQLKSKGLYYVIKLVVLLHKVGMFCLMLNNSFVL